MFYVMLRVNVLPHLVDLFYVDIYSLWFIDVVIGCFVHGINYLAAASAQQTSGSGDKVPPARPPPPRTQQPAQGNAPQALPCSSPLL